MSTIPSVPHISSNCWDLESVSQGLNPSKTCVLVFHCYDQNTEHKQIKGGKIDFGSWFQRLQPTAGQFVALGLRYGRTSWQKKTAQLMAARDNM